MFISFICIFQQSSEMGDIMQVMAVMMLASSQLYLMCNAGNKLTVQVMQIGRGDFTLALESIT